MVGILVGSSESERFPQSPARPAKPDPIDPTGRNSPGIVIVYKKGSGGGNNGNSIIYYFFKNWSKMHQNNSNSQNDLHPHTSKTRVAGVQGIVTVTEIGTTAPPVTDLMPLTGVGNMVDQPVPVGMRAIVFMTGIIRCMPTFRRLFAIFC